MSCRLIVAALMIVIALLFAAPNAARAFELHRMLSRCCPPSPAAAVANRQHAARWYPQYRTWEHYGGGVPTYAYGYFGAVGHSSYGCHRGYYGDLYQWSPFH